MKYSRAPDGVGFLQNHITAPFIPRKRHGKAERNQQSEEPESSGREGTNICLLGAGPEGAQPDPVTELGTAGDQDDGGRIESQKVEPIKPFKIHQNPRADPSCCAVVIR